jgi:hypothetical protein
MPSFHERMLSPEGMKTAYEAVAAAFHWATHATSVDAFESIRANGLQPRSPETAHPEPEVRRALGEKASQIVCGSLVPRRSPLLLNKNVPLFKISFPIEALVSVGIDWSFGGAWKAAEELSKDRPDLSDAEVFLTFHAVSPYMLHACPRADLRLHPSIWPLIGRMTQNDVANFEPDLAGNVSV